MKIIGNKKIKMFFTFTRKKECVRFTLFSWMLLFSFVLLILLLLVHNVHSFLSISSPVNSKILVVEGHIPDCAIDSAKAIILKIGYQQVFTTGIPMTQGGSLCGYSNYADLTAASLIARGVDSTLITSVPCILRQKDRTYESAVALKIKLKKLHIYSGKINVLTTDTHARRTKLMFQKALGDSWTVGVISIKTIDYNTEKWWNSSFGTRAVVYEGLAWVYAAYFFNPNTN